MGALEQIRRLWSHALWADATILAAIEAGGAVSAEAVREFAHVLGAEEVWLSRLEARPATLPVWPELSREELAPVARKIQSGYANYLAALRQEDLPRPIAYTNTAGRSFETAVGDILLHVALHGQYHRGKVNLRLRQAGASPAPVDYIAFARGVAAATNNVSA